MKTTALWPLCLLAPLALCSCSDEDETNPVNTTDAGASDGASSDHDSGPGDSASGSDGDGSSTLEDAGDAGRVCQRVSQRKCESASGTGCCPLVGTAYRFDAAHACKTEIYSASEDLPYDCIYTGLTGANNSCTAESAETCYIRTQAGQIEVVLSSEGLWPTYMTLTAWTRCTPEQETTVRAAPACR